MIVVPIATDAGGDPTMILGMLVSEVTERNCLAGHPATGMGVGLEALSGDLRNVKVLLAS